MDLTQIDKFNLNNNDLSNRLDDISILHVLNNVQVIIVNLKEDFNLRPYLTWFTSDISQKIITYYHYRDQLMSFTSQLLQRYYLAKLCGVTPHKLSFEFTKHHKPYISTIELLNCKFNISHSYNYVVMGFYRGYDYNIGVDIEQIDATVEIEQMAPIVFSESERQLIGNSAINFFKLWTKKEALIKALGTGFATDFYQDTQINLNDIEATKDYYIITQKRENYFLSVCLYKTSN